MVCNSNQTSPDGLLRAMLLVEVLGAVQKFQTQLPHLKKLGDLLFFVVLISKD